MPSKKDVQKRRLAARQAAEAQERAATAKTRRKRRTTGLIGGFLAIALVIPLAAGLVALLDRGGDDPEPLPLDDLALPAEIRPIPEGAALTGPTPCPATDGSQVRTTSFEQPPELCIDTAVDYEVVLTTDVGAVTVTVDPSLDEQATNLFVTMARYGLYDDMPFNSLVPQGLAVVADPSNTDPGFTVEPSSPDDGRMYDVGTVVLLADLSDRVASQFAFITTPEVAGSLGEDPVHPVIGSVTAGQGVIDAIIAIGASADTQPQPINDIRVATATVNELG